MRMKKKSEKTSCFRKGSYYFKVNILIDL